MATVTKKIGFTIDIDEDAIAPQSWMVWVYRWLNKLGYEHNIQSITVDDVTVAIPDKQTLYDLPLGENQELTT